MILSPSNRPHCNRRDKIRLKDQKKDSGSDVKILNDVFLCRYKKFDCSLSFSAHAASNWHLNYFLVLAFLQGKKGYREIPAQNYDKNVVEKRKERLILCSFVPPVYHSCNQEGDKYQQEQQ
jgi:hypothetical protein